MELIRLIAEIIIDWFRDTLVNVGGRIAEEVIGSRLKRRNRRSNRKRKSGTKPGGTRAASSPRQSTIIHRRQTETER